MALFFPRSFSGFFERLGSRRAFVAWLAHFLFRARCDTFAFSCDVCIESRFGSHDQHFHRLSDALARSASPLACLTTPSMRAQKLALRPSSALVFGLGAGAFKLEPVAALYFSRPLAVKPAPLDTGSFSPRPTLKDTFFFMRPSIQLLRLFGQSIPCVWAQCTPDAPQETQM